MQFQVQSPGACHVYTVEQAPSNHEVVWCGTATAGAWKSIDHGAHWTLMTRDLPLTSVYSVAIHPEDELRVWVGSGSGQLWRTEDGAIPGHFVGTRLTSPTTGGTVIWCFGLPQVRGNQSCLRPPTMACTEPKTAASP